MALKKFDAFKAFRAGSRNALQYYIWQDGDKIYNLFLLLGEHQEVAKALTEKVFVTAFTIRKKFRSEDRLRSALAEIAWELHQEDLFRRTSTAAICGDADRARIEFLTELRRSFRKLSVRKRRILVFYFFRKMTTHQIAARLELATQTPLNHKTQAIACLKKDMGPKWYDKNNPFLYS